MTMHAYMHSCILPLLVLIPIFISNGGSTSLTDRVNDGSSVPSDEGFLATMYFEENGLGGLHLP